VEPRDFDPVGHIVETSQNLQVDIGAIIESPNGPFAHVAIPPEPDSFVISATFKPYHWMPVSGKTAVRHNTKERG
jgi:hypothetical protein